MQTIPALQPDCSSESTINTMQIRASRVSGVSGVGGGLSSACLWDGTEKTEL